MTRLMGTDPAKCHAVFTFKGSVPKNSLLRSDPTLTQSALARRLGLSVKAIEKNIRQLKDAQRLRRTGPDKGGHWEVA